MIPLKDYNPTSRTAYVTIAIIAINIVVFFAEPVLGQNSPQEQAQFFACQAAIPYEVTHGERIAEVRGQFETELDNIYAELEFRECPHKNVWLSILKSMFLHGSILHIAGNMLFLWVFGNNVEDRLGAVKYIVFYLACGLAATYAQSYIFPGSAQPLIGASGAIAGVLGAYLVMFPRARVKNLVFIFIFITTIDLPAVVVLGLWFLLQIFQGVGSVAGDTGVAYMAHGGGFVAGMLLLFLFRPRPAYQPPAPYP